MCATDLQSSGAAMETTAGKVTAGNNSLFQSVQLNGEMSFVCRF